MANKILFSNSKMFFPLAMWGSRYVKQISICMHPSNACLLSLTKTKGKILLHRGIAWVTLFIVLLLDLMIQRRWKKTSLDQAQAQQKGLPKQCPSFRRRSNSKQFPIANGKFLLHFKNFQWFFAISNSFSVEKDLLRLPVCFEVDHLRVKVV